MIKKLNTFEENNFKLSLFYSTTLFESNEIDEDINPISRIISSFNEVEYILNKKNDDIFKILYFNKKNLNKILYKEDKLIQINEELIKSDLSYYFYLILLLEDNPNIVNYEYSIDLIKNINNELEMENNNKFKLLITSKLILELIKNYKELDYYDEEKDGEDLQKFVNNILIKIKDCIKNLKKLNINIDENNIINDKIDKIYIDIINNLIKSKKFENYEKCKGIMEQLEIEKINITKTMYDELLRTLNINDDYIKKYLILEIKDLFDEKKINFYFILLKYIIKSNIYIYQIPFLLQSKKNISKIIKSNINNFPININDNNKLKYIFYFLLDSKYYSKQISKNSISGNVYNEINKAQKINNDIIDQQYNGQNNGINKTKIQTIITHLSEDNEDIYKILNFENIIEHHKKRINSSAFIKEMSNGYFITGGSGDIIYIYDKDFQFKRMLKFEMKNTEQREKSTQQYSNQIKEIEFKISQNIIETNESIKNKGNNKVEIIECSKYGLLQFSIDFNNNNKITASNPFCIPCSGYFEINNHYILYGEKGLFDFNDKPFTLNINSNEELLSFRKNNINYKGGIKINDNLIALTSNKIFPFGEDIIVFYDIKKKK